MLPRLALLSSRSRSTCSSFPSIRSRCFALATRSRTPALSSSCSSSTPRTFGAVSSVTANCAARWHLRYGSLRSIQVGTPYPAATRFSITSSKDIGNRQFSSPPSRTPKRLARPASFTKQQRQPAPSSDPRYFGEDGGAEMMPAPPSRPHAISFFPGDFRDGDEHDPFGFDDDDGDDDWLSGGSVQDRQEALEREAFLEELRKREAEDRAKRERWMRNAAKPERTPQVDAQGRSYGRGGRKRAQARVWITPGFGEVVVNRRPFVDYFDRLSDRELVLAPFVATETCGAFDVQVQVKGGGLTGQAGAVRHGLSRALQSFNPDLYRPPLKRLGFLTRDARKVERKKIGRVKARKSPQWVRR